jgi:Holliday junction DNA helicase RuvA
MIAHLSGTVLTKKPLFMVIDVQGVGYRVFCTDRLLADSKTGDSIDLHIHTVVREDALDLYGFQMYEEVELFMLLINVSGIGPRSALGIMSLETLEKLLSAIAHSDIGYLTKVSGVGKKSAEKIILELKDKVGRFDTTIMQDIRRGEEDVLEALKTLGYRADEARTALRQVPDDITEQSDVIKEALRRLS